MPSAEQLAAAGLAGLSGRALGPADSPAAAILYLRHGSRFILEALCGRCWHVQRRTKPHELPLRIASCSCKCRCRAVPIRLPQHAAECFRNAEIVRLAPVDGPESTHSPIVQNPSTWPTLLQIRQIHPARPQASVPSCSVHLQALTCLLNNVGPQTMSRCRTAPLAALHTAGKADLIALMA